MGGVVVMCLGKNVLMMIDVVKVKFVDFKCLLFVGVEIVMIYD